MIYYIFSLILTLSGVVTDLELHRGSLLVCLQQGYVIRSPQKDTLWDGTKLVWNEQEMGLIGITSTPKEVYLNYSGFDSAQHIIRVSDGKELLKISHKQFINNHPVLFKQHKGGALDIHGKYLYICSGDGGMQGDPTGNAQNPNSMLGKIIKYDLEQDTFTIWAKGLRNPWKIAIVEHGKDAWMHITDVGWYEREEVTLVPLNADSVNLGWNCFEGSYQLSQDCAGLDLTFPYHEYENITGGAAIIGAWVDRGRFIYADHYKDTLYMVGENILKQKGIKNLTVIKDGYAGAYNGKVYKLKEKPQTASPTSYRMVLSLDFRPIDENSILAGERYWIVENGRLILAVK